MAKLAIAPPTHYLLDLPDEVLVICIDLLDIEDVLRFRCSCKRVRRIIDETTLIWRSMMRRFYSSSCGVPHLVSKSSEESWRSLFMKRHLTQKAVSKEIQAFAAKSFHRHNLSKIHAEEFLDQVQSTSSIKQADCRNYIADALHKILQLDPDMHLTDKYYARKLLYFVQTSNLASFWKDLKSTRHEKGSFYDYIEGLVAFAQWFQPQEIVDLEKVRYDVECVAVRTLENLHLKRPDHPIFQQERLDSITACSMKKLLFEKTPRDPPFNLKDCKAILATLNETFYMEFGFMGNSSNYYNANNSYVNKVLQTKQGIPITLCLIYSAVAAKLGLLCLPVNNPGHFLTCWSFTEGQSFLIDCFKGGSQVEVDKVEGYASPLQVFQRMVRNLVYVSEIQDSQGSMNRHQEPYPLLLPSLELHRILDSVEEAHLAAYGVCRLYLQLNINHREVLGTLDSHRIYDPTARVELRPQVRRMKTMSLELMERNREEELESIAKEPNFRGAFEVIHSLEEVSRFGKYAVGMVMKHRMYNYTCVIYGWDPTCEASRAWIRQMGVDQLPLKDKQPFYNVLVEDCSLRYAADENLIPCKPQRIANPLVGKYFMEFDEVIGYIPNSELSMKYPEDGPVQLSFQGSWRNNS